MPEAITKAELARRLGVTRARISQYSTMGMPVLPGGTVDYETALAWVQSNVAVHSIFQPGRMLAAESKPRVRPPTKPPEWPDDAA